ncbi:MAG: hypothetical protein ABIH50_04820 [bacterium]
MSDLLVNCPTNVCTRTLEKILTSEKPEIVTSVCSVSGPEAKDNLLLSFFIHISRAISLTGEVAKADDSSLTNLQAAALSEDIGGALPIILSVDTATASSPKVISPVNLNPAIVQSINTIFQRSLASVPSGSTPDYDILLLDAIEEFLAIKTDSLACAPFNLKTNPENPSIKKGETLASLTINGPHLERVKIFDIPEGLRSATDPKTEVEVKKDPTSGNVVLVLKYLKAASTYTATTDEPIILKNSSGEELGRFSVKVVVPPPTAEEPKVAKLRPVMGKAWFERYFYNYDDLSVAERVGPYAKLSAAGIQAGGSVTPKGEGRVNVDVANRDATINIDPYVVAEGGFNSEVFQPHLQKIAKAKLFLTNTQQTLTNPITGGLNSIPNGSSIELKLDKTGFTPKASLSGNVFGVWNPTLTLAGKFFKSDDISLHPVSDRNLRDRFSPFAPDQADKDVLGLTLAVQPLRTSMFFKAKEENEWFGFTLGGLNPTFNAVLNPTQLNRKLGYDYLPDGQISPTLNLYEAILGTNNKLFLLMGSTHGYAAPGLNLYKQYSQAEIASTDPTNSNCSSQECPKTTTASQASDQKAGSYSRLNLFSQGKFRLFGDNRLRADWHLNDQVDVGGFVLIGGEFAKAETINHTEQSGLIWPRPLQGWELTTHTEAGFQLSFRKEPVNLQIIPALGAHKTWVGMYNDAQVMRPQPYFPTDEFYGKLSGSVGLNKPSWLNASLGFVGKLGVSNDPFGQGYPNSNIGQTLMASRYPNLNASGLLTLSVSLAAGQDLISIDDKSGVSGAKRPNYRQPDDK